MTGGWWLVAGGWWLLANGHAGMAKLVRPGSC